MRLFTDKYLKSLKPREKRYDQRERDGFGIRVFPSGVKSFVFFYTFEGRKRRMTLGEYPGMSLKKAREKYLSARKTLIEDEVDPATDRQRVRDFKTVSQLCDKYLEDCGVHKKTVAEDERRIEKVIKPAWGLRKARSITREDVETLFRKVGADAPYSANRLLALIQKMWNEAQGWSGYVDRQAPNPAKGIKRYREEKRDRWIRPTELPQLAKAIRDEESIFVRAAFWLYLLTGARKQELLQVRWADVDTELMEIRIPDTKAGRTHHIPLTPQALTVLESLPTVEGNPYVFPGTKKSSHLANIDKAWRRIRSRATVYMWCEDERVAEIVETLRRELDQKAREKRAAGWKGKVRREPMIAEIREAVPFDLAVGVEDVRLHDLRRTVGSWMAQDGESLPLIGAVLGHSTVETTKIYARLGEDQPRKALERYSVRILEAAEGLRVVEGGKG